MLLHDILLLLIGLALIIVGGNYVTDGGVIIANRLKISPLVVGLTIVALGSSAPDLAVSVFATAQGHTSMAVGDVVGADIFDLLLVVGVTLLVMPVVVERDTYRMDLPMLVVAAGVFFVFANNGFITGRGDSTAGDSIGRFMGIAMLLMYIAFVVLIVNTTRRSKAPVSHRHNTDAAPKGREGVSNKKVWIAIAMIVGGLAALVVGGNWIVDGGSGIARKAGMSEALVGLTIVGIGSSLPDLSTSVMAALKHQPGLAIGNVVGASIFDILVVIGASASIRPLQVHGVSFMNFCVLLGAALLLMLLSLRKGHKLTRAQGGVFVALYIGYIAWMISTSV